MLTRSSIVGRASIVLALVGASALIATPAIAAPGDLLPDGQQITGTVYMSPDDLGFGIQPVSVDSVTGVSTPLGAFGQGLSNDTYASLDVDANGQGYMLTDSVSDSEWSMALAAIDANTGAIATPVAFSTANGSEIDYCDGLDYTAGVVRSICTFSFIDETYVRAISTIDTSGVVTAEVVVNPDLESGLNELAMGPDGTLYVFGADGSGVPIYAVAPGAIELDGTVHATIDTGWSWISGADFDRAGQLWVATASEGTSELLTIDVATGDSTSVAPTTLEGGDVTLQGLTVWGNAPAPEPTEDPARPAPVVPAVDGPTSELAESGVDAASIGLLSGAALLAGGVLFFLRRRSSESVN